ncbi:Inner membrane protein OxaA [Candidatus Glomeribacter gigasporarum BEG34]|uniref:Membrane protein insertase YidC n=1 Tax=Candidatus Glomeribacter gigasporarum BEG34 TaxID=1070319 RepID=G2J8L9_9BURK|nr:membrane protein insertase YidC [Candidatus Glomeribacter gigasporarum]CCD29116.1 Inner membrane protein OxaA [Candidatus Glomeribacter gigasporarum BEG34]
MDVKRSVLWIIFTISLVMLFDNWQREHGRSSLFFPSATSPQTSGIRSSNTRTADLPPVSENRAPDQPGAPAGEKVHVKTDVYDIQIDTRGGTLSKLRLVRPGGTEKSSLSMTLFDERPAHTYLARTGLVGGPSGDAFPNHHDLFTVQPGPRELTDGADTLEVQFKSPVKGGVQLVKTYRFTRGSYVMDVRHQIINAGATAVRPALYTELVRDNAPVEAPRFSHTFIGPAVYTAQQRLQKISFGDIDKGKAEYTAQADNGWIAMTQYHFASAWIAPQGTPREMYVGKLGPSLYRVGAKQNLQTVEPGQSIEARSRLFSGPAEERMLERIAPGLELVKDYGWMTLIAKPLFWLLEKIHSLLGNWGWSIIVLTLLIKAAFFPLSAASYRSMARMRKITPRMQTLREQFKGDPQKMNAALMALYKTEKVNPFGGCLPVLIQIPVFIALYWVLLASVEMRGAPWLGWIRDLSRPDPYFILPVLMTATMFIQTRLNPTPPDPLQAKMMLFMPLAFSVMFFFFPAGLVLYYVVNNMLSIAQQWYIARRFSNPVV